MESEKSEHVMTRAVAGATRMPSDGTDDDEVRERGAFLEIRFRGGQPNPVGSGPHSSNVGIFEVSKP